mgnify:CR=1 FL=1
MTEVVLFLLQRASALTLAPLVLVHTALVVGAVRGGPGAGEALLRARGSLGWSLFYGLFVVAAAVHAPLGLRSVLREWTPWRGRSLDLAMAGLGLLLLALGGWAIRAVLR